MFAVHPVDVSDNSNSSRDSDQLLQQGGSSYHDSTQAHQRGDIPVHRNESISQSVTWKNMLLMSRCMSITCNFNQQCRHDFAAEPIGIMHAVYRKSL